MDINDWLQTKYVYKNVCNLIKFKNNYPDLPVAQIDDVFFIHSQKVIYPERFGNKNSVDSINTSNKDYYYMVTIMEKLVDEHPDFNSPAVKSAKAVLDNLNIRVGDFRGRNIVKKICKEPYTDELKLHLEEVVYTHTVKIMIYHMSYLYLLIMMIGKCQQLEKITRHC